MVRSNASEGERFARSTCLYDVERVFELDSRFECRTRLAEGAIDFMIEIKMLATAQRAPRNQSLHVHHEAAVGALPSLTIPDQQGLVRIRRGCVTRASKSYRTPR